MASIIVADELPTFVGEFASEYFKAFILLETLIDGSHPDFYEPFLSVFQEFLGETPFDKESYLDAVYEKLSAVMDENSESIRHLYGANKPLHSTPTSVDGFWYEMNLLWDLEERCLR